MIASEGIDPVNGGPIKPRVLGVVSIGEVLKTLLAESRRNPSPRVVHSRTRVNFLTQSRSRSRSRSNTPTFLPPDFPSARYVRP